MFTRKLMLLVHTLSARELAFIVCTLTVHDHYSFHFSCFVLFAGTYTTIDTNFIHIFIHINFLVDF